MRKVFVLFLVLTCFLTLAMPAFAADSDYLPLRLQSVENETYGALDSLKMTGTSKTKELFIDEEALKYLIDNDKTLKINMEYLTVTIPAAAWNCTEYQQALKTGEPVSVTFTVDIWSLNDEYQYFNAANYSAKGMYKAEKSNFSLELDYAAGTNHFIAQSFGAPITIAASYEWQNIAGLTADSVAFYWMDKEKALSSYNYEWIYVPGTTDGKNCIVTFNTNKAYGNFMAVGAKTHTTADGSEATDPTVDSTGASIYGHWAEDDIIFMQQKFVVLETADTFYPNRPITRAEFAAYLVRTLKLDTDTSLAGKFSDVPQSHTAYNEIYTAAKAGIINGQTDTTFAPDATITRQELAVMIARALKQAGQTVDTDATTMNGFHDAEKVAAWAKEGMAIAVNGGYIAGGTLDGSGWLILYPEGNTTRAEAVVILHRLYDKLN